MEWIETTGKTVEEAKDAALDELGVDETDAEFEVVEEPRTGLFGRTRGEARVRSRVRPTAPRPKEDRRDRRRKGRTSSAPTSADDPSGGAAGAGAVDVLVPSGVARQDAAEDGDGDGPALSRPRRSSPGGGDRLPDGDGRPPGRRRDGTDSIRTDNDKDDKVSAVDIPLDEQGRVAADFLSGLINEFGLSADIAVTVNNEDDVVDISLSGDGLGLLIGPKGSTLVALQDLTRSAVQQKTSAGNGRIHVDISGYRQKRSEALARFAHQVASTVATTGVRQALEPMSAVDRKVVHDALTDTPGVSTLSEGEDAGRRVVVVPATD